MGQTLSEPVTTKDSYSGQDDTLAFAVSGMQGWRVSMEDAHATVLQLDDKTGDEKTSFFAVYDGHGGAEAAKYAAKALHGVLAEQASYKDGQYKDALKQAFLKTDRDFFADNDGDPSGCTAVAALLVAAPPSSEAAKAKAGARQIIVANAGDSRSILGIKGEAKPLSFDHKPGNKDENARIVSAGGYVEFGRVNGNLALSRAIGDAEFKRNPSLSQEAQIVTADPEIIAHDVTGEEEFLILACDGIWDCLSNQQVVDFVRREIAKGTELEKICENIFERCLAPDSEIGGVGCDNMTFCIVALLQGRSKEEWYSWVKERVDNKVGWETPEDIAPVFQPRPPGANNAGAAGRMNPQGLLQHLLPGGVGAFGDVEDGEEGGEEGNPLRGLRLNPGGLAAALGGGRIVLRPGQPDEKGEATYEAHVVDDDDEDDDEDDDDEDDGAPQQQGDGAKKVPAQSFADKLEATEAQSSAADSESERPNLTHQPEIVQSPAASAGEDASSSQAQKSDESALGVRPSSEGTGAAVQHARQGEEA
ncbi:unnamed protein product [Parajaminaea phylloscopi]